MRILSVAAILCALTVAAAAHPPLPYAAQDFTIAQPNGQKTQLSSYKGKVVLMEFLFTTCPHCQAAARMFTKLQKEYGPRGFQSVGVGFNEEANAAGITGFIQATGASYPIGMATRDQAMAYLGLPIMGRWVVPQILIIDRKGIVRAQSEPMGTEQLQDEGYLRNLIESLLKESAGPATTKTAPATKAPVKTPVASAKSATN